MPNVNLNNLDRFWDNAKRYIAARDADQCDWTSVPVNAPVYQFEAEPHTPVNPVIEFGFTETPPASGEKSPTNPSTITGVDSVTVGHVGKNLLLRKQTGYSGYTITRNEDGSLFVNGSGAAMFSVTDGGPASSGTKSSVVLDTSKYYTLSVELVSGTISGVPCISLIAPSETEVSLRIPSSGKASQTFIHRTSNRFICRMLVGAGESLTNAVLRIQLEEGATATAFEAPMLPETVNCTVTLGETRYGGTLDVATGKMTVTGTKYEIIPGTADTSTFDASQHCYMFKPVNVAVPKGRAIGTEVCTHFIFGSEYNGSTNHFYCGANGTIYFFNSAWSTESDAASFFHTQNTAGTPVTVYYPAANPVSTVDLDPQQLFSVLSSSHVNTISTDTGNFSQLTYAKPAPSQEDVFRYANWHRTETAGIVACCPVPESELHPVVSFSFTETAPEEGDKSPSNPSTITGVSSANVTRCGKNLARSASTVTMHNVTITNNKDGSYTVNGTANADVCCPVLSNFIFYCKNGEKLAISGAPNSGDYTTYALQAVCYTKNNVFVNSRYTGTNGSPQVLECGADGYVQFNIVVKNGTTVNNLVFRPQLEIGETASSFEAPVFNNYTISLGGTYYGGSIDLSTGLMTVTHEAETITHDNANASVEVLTNTIKMTCNISNKHLGGSGDIYWACEKFLCDATNNDIEHIRPSGPTVSGAFSVLIFINKSRLDVSGAANPSSPTGAEWKAAGNVWLASNPVTLIYKFFTPTIVQLTPQQIKALPALDRCEPRINTLYTDADSIQVEYQKSPIQTEREITNAILALNS